MKQHLTFGIEATFIPRWHNESRFGAKYGICYSYKYSWKLAKVINRAFVKKGYPKAKKDIHCVEVCSPVFKSLTELTKWYSKLRSHALANNFTPHNKSTVCGGGHLHIGGLTKAQIRQCMSLLYRYPSIPWTFLQPDDTDSANLPQLKIDKPYSNLCVTDRRQLAFFLKSPEWLTKRWFCFNHHLPFLDTKQFAADYSNNGKTIQYRCIEAPKTVAELQLQLQFFKAFTLWALKQPLTPVVYPENLQSIKRFEAIAQFESICQLIGVNYRDYKHLIRRNLMPRWELGRKRT